MPAREAKLTPTFQAWTDLGLMTQDEALQIQERACQRLAGSQEPVPEHLMPAMRRLQLWADQGPSTMH